MAYKGAKRPTQGQSLAKTGGLSLTPEVQTALWQCYLPLDSVRVLPSPNSLLPLEPLANFLDKSQAAIPKPLLGLAVWNLVLSCEDQPEGQRTESPPALVDLLQSILQLDVDAAVQMRQEQPTALLPTFSDQNVVDSRYEQQTSKDGAQATVQICVPFDFDAVKQIVQPAHWADHCFLWSRTADGQPALELSLPTSGPRPVHLVQPNPNDHDGRLEAKVGVDIDANDLLKLCHGELTLKKEEGLPGAVRLINQKTVSFAHEPLARYATETLKYWLATEAVSLVMLT